MPEFHFGIERDDVFALNEELRTAYELFIGFSLVSVAREAYLNFKTPRHRGFYGYAQLMMGEFVAETIQLEFTNQMLYHNRQDALPQTDLIVCGVRLLVECACNNPITGFIVKGRRPITSVRFRLAPGILGNCVVKHSPVVTNCENEVRDPDPSEGNPPGGRNGDYVPSNQPGDSVSDPSDPTGNDGQDPNAPSPGLPGTGGRWETDVAAYNPDFPVFTFTAEGNADDEYIVEAAPPRNDSDCPNGQPRIRGMLNGSQVWITSNCVSTVEALETRYVPNT